MLKVYAHRVDSTNFTENTCAAFEAALATKAYGIETDLHLTRDGYIVLNHDHNLCRLGDDPTLIHDLDCLELKRRLQQWGITLVTLSSFWRAFAGRINVNLEVKDIEVFAPLSLFLRDNPIGDILITSSHWKHLGKLEKMLPHIKIGPVVESYADAKASLVSDEPFDVVSLDRDAYHASLISLSKERGRQLFLWTVNDPEDASLFAKQGVEGIFRDDPGRICAELMELGVQLCPPALTEEG